MQAVFFKTDQTQINDFPHSSRVEFPKFLRPLTPKHLILYPLKYRSLSLQCHLGIMPDEPAV